MVQLWLMSAGDWEVMEAIQAASAERWKCTRVCIGSGIGRLERFGLVGFPGVVDDSFGGATAVSEVRSMGLQLALWPPTHRTCR